MLRRTLLVLALAAIPLAAQNSGTITGKITDAVTRQPIAKVHVGCRVDGAFVGVLSGPDGAYTLENVPPGEAGMTLNREGYKLISDNGEASAEFRIAAGDSITRDFAMHPLGRIYGRLTDRNSGKLLEGHIVNAARRDYVPGSLYYMASRSEPGPGEFEVANLEAGDYVIGVESPREAAVGFPPDKPPARPAQARVYGVRYYPDVPRREMAATIHLGEGEARRLDIALEGAEPYTLSGTVIAPAGFEHEQVFFAFRISDPGPGRVQMPAPGPFRVENLAPGTYRLDLTAGKPPHELAANYEIVITDHDVENFKATLMPEAGVSGEIRMLEENVKPPDHVGLMLIPTAGWFLRVGKRGSMVSGPLPILGGQAEFGRIRQDSIRQGEYWPNFILPDGYAVVEVRFEGASAHNNVIAVNGPETPLTVVLTSRPGAVGGVVRTEDQTPVRGVEVALLPDPLPDKIAPSTIQFTESGEAGTFVFKNVAPGMYRAVVLKGGEDVRSAGAALRDAAAKAEAIEVRAGQSASVNLKP